jgi:hypothetical protein
MTVRLNSFFDTDAQVSAMSRSASHAALKTAGVCVCIECVVFLLFLAVLRNALAAAYWTLLIGPISLFMAPFIYRKFQAQASGRQLE